MKTFRITVAAVIMAAGMLISCNKPTPAQNAVFDAERAELDAEARAIMDEYRRALDDRSIDLPKLKERLKEFERRNSDWFDKARKAGWKR